MSLKISKNSLHSFGPVQEGKKPSG